MRYQEILEACWTGYQQQGMKEKGNRQVPNCVPVEEAVDTFLDNTARELLGLVIIAGGAFAVGTYYTILNKLKKYQGSQIINALERKGITVNRDTYLRIKPVLDQFRQALKDNNGAEAKELAKQIEQMVVMGKLSAPDLRAQDTTLANKEQELQEDLKKWFKEKWVRFGPDGKIRGDCARGSSKEGKPKCLPQSKAQALGKKGRAASAAKKRRQDPNPERRGKAKNVATKVQETITDVQAGMAQIYSQLAPKIERYRDSFLAGQLYDELENYAELHGAEKEFKQMMNGARNRAHMDYDTNPGGFQNWFWYLPFADEDITEENQNDRNARIIAGEIEDAMSQGNEKLAQEKIKQLIGVGYTLDNQGRLQRMGMYEDEQLQEKQDACYRKVKSRYKVWPSAYASGALVQCRKKGAANWGNKKK